MTWFRVDTDFLQHPKAQHAGPLGRELWHAGLTYCTQQLTDGRIPKAMVPALAALAGVKPSLASKLVEAPIGFACGLWEDHGDYYVMHDYHDHQPSREKALADKKAAAERQKRAREKARESQGKSQRESQRESRRDSQGQSRSLPNLTSPGPAPLLTVVPTTTTGSNGDRVAVEDVIQSAAAYQALIAKGSGVQPSKGWDAYEIGIGNRIRREDADRIAALIAQHPHLDADGVRDVYHQPDAITSLDELVPGLQGRP